MKLMVFRLSTILKILLLTLLMSAFFTLSYLLNPQAVEVFTSGKMLPIYYVDTPEKITAITFDCAWGASDIPDILKTLKDEDVKATFFLVGEWADRYPDIVKEIAASGHDIANHSMSHLRMASLSTTKIKSEILQCGEKLSSLSDQKINLFRPPYGEYNNSVVSIAQSMGYHVIQWNVDSLDWKPGINSSEIQDRILKKIKNGSIILFHNDTKLTAKILPQIIASLKREKYQLLPVSKLILKDNYEIDFDGRQKSKIR